MEKLRNIEINTNEPYNKILYWFFSFPDASIGLEELRKKVRISKSNANKIVNQLEKEGFLIKEVIGKAWRIKCNRKHKYNKNKKIAFNLQIIADSDIIERIYKKYPGFQTIILFGSYRKGDDIEKSDIDIAIIIDNKNLEITELGVIEKIGYRKNVPVNLHIFSKDKIDKNLFLNIINGIVLDGFLELK